MRIHATSKRIVASLLVTLLASCGSTRHSAPASTGEFTRLALVIQEQPDGTWSHSWTPAEELELSRVSARSRARVADGRVEPVVRRPRDCDQENRDCFDECMLRPLSRGFGHMTSGGRKKGGKQEYCTEQCRQSYQDCADLEKLRPQEFEKVDAAVDWLKRNRRSILLGSVVIIAGVVFVVASMGAGLVILAPAVLLATEVPEAGPFMSEVSP